MNGWMSPSVKWKHAVFVCVQSVQWSQLNAHSSPCVNSTGRFETFYGRCSAVKPVCLLIGWLNVIWKWFQWRNPSHPSCAARLLCWYRTKWLQRLDPDPTLSALSPDTPHLSLDISAVVLKTSLDFFTRLQPDCLPHCSLSLFLHFTEAARIVYVSLPDSSGFKLPSSSFCTTDQMLLLMTNLCHCT